MLIINNNNNTTNNINNRNNNDDTHKYNSCLTRSMFNTLYTCNYACKVFRVA